MSNFSPYEPPKSLPAYYYDDPSGESAPYYSSAVVWAGIVFGGVLGGAFVAANVFFLKVFFLSITAVVVDNVIDGSLSVMGLVLFGYAVTRGKISAMQPGHWIVFLNSFGFFAYNISSFFFYKHDTQWIYCGSHVVQLLIAGFLINLVCGPFIRSRYWKVAILVTAVERGVRSFFTILFMLSSQEFGRSADANAALGPMYIGLSLLLMGSYVLAAYQDYASRTRRDFFHYYATAALILFPLVFMAYKFIRTWSQFF